MSFRPKSLERYRDKEIKRKGGGFKDDSMWLIIGTLNKYLLLLL